MKSNANKKLVKQIFRLCEKQYRKGFQQGALAIEGGLTTVYKANNFRSKGMSESYSKVVDPISGQVYKPMQILQHECKMGMMTELYELLKSIDE